MLGNRFHLPLALARPGARKIDHPRHSDGHSKGTPDGRRLSAGIDSLGGLCNSCRLDARLLTDALELIEAQPARFSRQRPVVRVARRRETENLAYLLVFISTLGSGLNSTALGALPKSERRVTL